MAASSATTMPNGVFKDAPVPMEVEGDNKSDALSDSIEKIVISCEGRKDSRTKVFEAAASAASDDKKHAATTSDMGGSLRPQELAQLSRLCLAALTTTSELDFGVVDGELLALLCGLLQEHVCSAAQVDLVKEACHAIETQSQQNENKDSKGTRMTIEKWLKGTPESPVGPGMKRLVVLKNGLEASSILLSIMTAPSVDRRVISEECIESCITLTRQCLYKNIIPAITSTGHLAFAGSEEPTPKKQKKTKPETKQQGLMKSLKQVYTYILASSDLFLGVLERMDALVQVIALEDGMVLTLATTALSVFPVEPSVATQSRTCHSLHVASISLLTTIFQKYPRHRTIILEDLFPLLLKLPTSKKSLRTFCVHTESDVVTVKRALHHHHGGGSEQDSIQAITALILSLIQCSVEMPLFQSTDEEQDEETTLKSGLGQCQAVCHFFATQLLQRCAKRGQDGGASEFRPILGNLVDDLLLLLLSPEYPSASMLLLIMNRILANDMLKASSIVPKTAGMPHAEATYLNTAFDVLGKISAAAAGILAAYRDKPLKIASEQDNGASSAKVESSCHCGRSHTQQFMVNCDDCKGWYHGECVCLTKTNVPRVWICDDCRLKRMVVEETRVFAERSKRTQPKGMDLCLSECVSDTHILRQLLLNHLTEESSSTLDSPARQFARKVHLAMWIEELSAPQATGTDTEDSDRAKNEFVSRLLCDHFLQQWDASEGDVQAAKNDHTVGSSSRRCLNKEGNMRLMLNLTATKSGLVTSFPRQIGLLLQLMADEAQTSVRKLSVKAISQVLEADPTLMLHSAVKKAVSDRFVDDAKSVREAAVALVGNFVVQTPEIANAFHSSLLKCLNDDGVSVKKRAVKIFRQILENNPTYLGRAAACALLLRRAADPKEDDSVRDLIHEFFVKLWLEASSSVPASGKKLPTREPEESVPNDEAVAAFSPITGAGIVTPLTPHRSSAVASEETSSAHQKKRPRNATSVFSPRQTRGFLAAEQMVEVVMAADCKDVLATLLKHLMYGLTDADKDRKTAERQERNKELHSQCSFLVDSMMEQLLLLEENRERLGNTFGKKLVALFRSLAVFGEIAPVEVLRHLDTVTPYLKADNSVSHEQESHIVSEISELITLVAPNMTSRDIMRMTDGAVIDDLVTITKRFGSGPLSNAMRALGSLAKHCLAEGDNAITKKQMKLVSSFYGYLLKNKLNNVDFSKPDVKLRNNTSRALSVLAAFCRYYEVDEEKEEWLEMADVNDVAAQDLTSANVMHACYSLFLWYLQRDDAAMKCAALRALSCVFIARPPVMLNLEQDGTIEDLMSPDSPVELQLESLLCWKEILISEANRVDSGEAKKKMKSKKGLTLSKQISGDLDGEATVLAGVVHQHSSRFYEMTTHKDQRIRLATVELLGVLLSQGQLNPMDAVKYLFAMQGDVQAPSVRALSLRLLIAEKEKRAEMIRQRGLAGVKQAYKLQRAVYSSTLEPTAVIKRKRGKTEEVVSVFDSAFKECIRDAKKHKMGLYRSLLGLFASDMFDEEQFCRTSKKMAAKQKKDLSLLSFTAQVLAHLPYNVASDPLFIIHHLSGMTAIQGAQLLDRLSSFLRPYQLTTADELDNNVSEDILEKAAKSKSPSRKKEISRINGADFDLEKFSNLLGEACAMVLLLRLKTFLRKVYKLSELRCLEYSPEAKEVQKHLHPPENMPVFNASLEMATTAKRGGKCHDVDALIRLYAEFRILMRAEQSSTASSDSEETSPPSSSKKRKNSE